MPGTDDIVNIVSGWWGGAGVDVFQWATYIIYSLLILGFFTALFFLIQYKYKVILYKIEGGEVSKPKWERARRVKEKGVEKWNLLLTRRKIKPVDYSYIYPKNKVYLLRTGGDTFQPCHPPQTKLYLDENKTIHLQNLLKPVDDEINYWYQLQQQQIARDYMPDDASKKQLIITLGTIVLCLVLCGFTIWLVFKNVQPIVDGLSSLSNVQVPNWLQETAQGIAPN